MKRFTLLILSLAPLHTAFSQRLPSASPLGSVWQTIGVSDFKATYSRPGVKGRQIFGDSAALVPFGKVWVTGAHMASTLEAATEFSFGGQPVPAGKYALFSIPGPDFWTVILNKNYNQHQADKYKMEEDVARVQVSSESNDFLETLTYEFTNVTDSSAKLTIGWAATKMEVDIRTHTSELTSLGINSAIANHPEDSLLLEKSALYYLSDSTKLDEALALADKSIGLGETPANTWLKAQILKKMALPKDAIRQAEKALGLAKAQSNETPNPLIVKIEEALKNWAADAPRQNRSPKKTAP